MAPLDDAHIDNTEFSDASVEKVKIHDDIHHEEGDAKITENQFASLNRAELDTQIAELDEMAAQEHSRKTTWEKIYLFQIPLKIPESKMVLMLGVFAAFAGMLSGLDQSIISGAKYGMQQWFRNIGSPLTEHEIALIDSLMPIGAITGSLMMTPLNHFIGRRGSLIISCIWYTIGGILCAAAQNVHTLYVGRFFLGIGIGIEGGCVGIYISESVPATVRGNLVSLYQFMLAFGEVVGYAVGGIFFDVFPQSDFPDPVTGRFHGPGGWRIVLGSSLLFSTILLVGLFFLPESPRWLMSKNKPGEAWYVWKRLRDHDNVQAQIEFLELRQVSAREQEVASQEKWYERYLELFIMPRNRRALVYSLVMMFLGQMTGVNGVLYNMSSILENLNFSPKNSVLMSIPSGAALLFGTIPAILYMDRSGRRVWAQNLVGFFIGLVLVGIGSRFSYDDHKSINLGLTLTGIYLYMGFFGSYACLTWVVPAESFSLRTRAQGVSISSASVYLWAFVVTYNFTRMSQAFTYIGLMIGFFGGIAVLGFFFQLFFMPETKDRTLEEIDDIFSMKTSQIVAQNMRRLRARIQTCGLKSLDDLEGTSRAAREKKGVAPV